MVAVQVMIGNNVAWLRELWQYNFVQGLAEIPDDLAKQLWMELFAWGICTWALF